MINYSINIHMTKYILPFKIFNEMQNAKCLFHNNMFNLKKLKIKMVHTGHFQFV